MKRIIAKMSLPTLGDRAVNPQPDYLPICLPSEADVRLFKDFAQIVIQLQQSHFNISVSLGFDCTRYGGHLSPGEVPPEE